MILIVRVMLVAFVIIGVLLLIASSRLIFIKKQIFYGWIDTSKKIATFDYVTNFDGRWVFKSIDYKLLLQKYDGDVDLQSKIKEARLLSRICIALAVLLLASMITVKMLE